MGERIMHLYNIGYGTCEESSYKQYQHEEEYNEGELATIVKDCLIDVIDFYAGRFGEEGYHDPSFYVGNEGPSFQELMDDDKFKEALEGRGFRPIDFRCSFNTFGWASAIKPGNWSGHTGPEDNELQSQLQNRCEELGIFVETFLPNGEEKGGFTSRRLNRK
jgi:hypothetical protein